MRSLVASALGAALLLACKAPTGEEGPVGEDVVGDVGPKGAPGERTPTLTSIHPPAVYLGRQVEVLISGSDTAWEADSVLEFDFGPGVEVTSYQVASPTALVATLDVKDDATQGLRTVRVYRDGVAAASVSGFAVDPSLEVSPVGATEKDQLLFRRPFQGSVAQGVAFQLDEFSPFDQNPEHVDISIGGGARVQPLLYPSGLVVVFWLEVDVYAEPGFRRVAIESGPPGATVRSVTAYEPIEILERAPTPLALGENPGQFDVPDASRLFSYETGGADKLVSFRIAGEAPEALADIILLPESGRFVDEVRRLAKLDANTVTLHAIVPEEEERIFVVYRGFGGGSGYAFDVAVDERLTSEIPLLGAPLTPGEIAEPGESDWYRFEGEEGAPIHIEIVSDGSRPCGSPLAPGGIDSELEVLDASGNTIAVNDDRGANFCSVIDLELPASGTYFVRAASSIRFAKFDTFSYQLAFSEQ